MKEVLMMCLLQLPIWLYAASSPVDTSKTSKTFHLHQKVKVVNMPPFYAGCDRWVYITKYYPVSKNYVIANVYCPFEDGGGTYESLLVKAEDIVPWVKE